MNIFHLHPDADVFDEARSSSTSSISGFAVSMP